MDAIKKITQPIRRSSSNTYSSYFEAFVKFIKNRNRSECFPLSEVIEFFNFLANKGYKSGSLKGVRSALKEPLKLYFPEFDITEDEYIKKIIEYVRSHNAKPRVDFPSWNLDLVVNMLKAKEESDVEFLVKKALFLAFLACPYRIAEFGAISLSSSSFSPLHVILKTHYSYLSKNQSDEFTPRPIVIPAYERDPDICPVRLLNTYLNLTKAKCRERNVLRPDKFWLNLNGKPLAVSTMRRWIKEIIFLGDPNASMGLRVHSVRGQVSSHLLASGMPVREIMLAMNWRSSSTFREYYARLGIKTAVRAVLAGHPVC